MSPQERSGAQREIHPCARSKKGEQRLNGIAISRGGCDVPKAGYAGKTRRRKGCLSIFVGFLIPRCGDRRRTQACGLLRPQRSRIERQSQDQEKTDEIDRIRLRRGDRPPHKSSDRRHWIGIVRHGAVLLEAEGNWKGQMGWRSWRR